MYKRWRMEVSLPQNLVEEINAKQNFEEIPWHVFILLVACNIGFYHILPIFLE